MLAPIANTGLNYLTGNYVSPRYQDTAGKLGQAGISYLTGGSPTSALMGAAGTLLPEELQQIYNLATGTYNQAALLAALMGEGAWAGPLAVGGIWGQLLYQGMAQQRKRGHARDTLLGYVDKVVEKADQLSKIDQSKLSVKDKYKLFQMQRQLAGAANQLESGLKGMYGGNIPSGLKQEQQQAIEKLGNVKNIYAPTQQESTTFATLDYAKSGQQAPDYFQEAAKDALRNYGSGWDAESMILYKGYLDRGYKPEQATQLLQQQGYKVTGVPTTQQQVTEQKAQAYDTAYNSQQGQQYVQAVNNQYNDQRETDFYNYIKQYTPEKLTQMYGTATPKWTPTGIVGGTPTTAPAQPTLVPQQAVQPPSGVPTVGTTKPVTQAALTPVAATNTVAPVTPTTGVYLPPSRARFQTQL